VSKLTAELLHQAMSRDHQAVRALIGALTPIIQARAARVLLRRSCSRTREIRQDVLDLTQHIFVALFERDSRLLRTWDPSRGMSLENFVGLIAEQQVMAILRNRHQNPWINEPTESDELDGSVDSSRGPERLVASRQALSLILDKLRDQLSDRGLELFQLIYVEGRSVEEICSMTDMKADAVYAWRSRLGRLAQKIAREVLSEMDPALHKKEQGA